MKTKTDLRTERHIRPFGFFTLVVCWWLACFVVPAVSQYKTACSCLPPPSPGDEFGVSRSVFTGRVRSIKLDTLQSGPILRVILDVLHNWKSAGSPQMSLYTAMSTASCGFPFHVDSTYLVYTYRYLDTLATHLCTRTRLLSEAAEDLAFLTTVSVEKGPKDSGLPTMLELYQNYPNPANPATVFRFTLPHASRTLLTLHNLRGELVSVLLNADRAAGTYEISADLAGVASGVYICRLQTDAGARSRKFIVLK
jgi:hypothetical protein